MPLFDWRGATPDCRRSVFSLKRDASSQRLSAPQETGKKRTRTTARWAREKPALARVFLLPLLWLSPAAGAQNLTSNSRLA